MKVLLLSVLVAFGAAVSLSGLRASGDSSPAVHVTVRRVPNGGIQPQARLDNRGVLHLLYFAGEARAGNLFYVRSTDLGVTFSAPVRVNSHEGSAIAAGTIRGGQLAIGRDGRVHVAWNGSDAAAPRGVMNPRTGRATAPFLYASANARGTAFVAERNLMQASYDLDGGGTIAADTAGNVYAIWHANGMADPAGEANRRVWVTRSVDDGATFGVERAALPARNGACGCCGLSALATGTGQLQVLYRSVIEMTNRDVYLLLSSDKGQSFRESLVQEWDIGGCPMSSMALSETSSGVFGAWETAGQVYFGAIDSERAVVRTPTPAPGAATGRKHPRLASTETGHTLLVWTEGTAWARGGSLAWQVFGPNGKPVGVPGSAPDVPAWSFGAAIGTRAGFLVFH
jgi:hypothetical protein